MKRRVATVGIASLILLTIANGLLSFENGNVRAYTPHAPITIDGNADFATQAAAESWPGDGSIGNPYIIEGYDINASSAIGIEIQNTDVDFVIRDCFIHDGGVDFRGIYLLNLINGTIEHCNITNNSHGIEFDGVTDSVIFNNTIYNNSLNGIEFATSADITIQNNSIYSNIERGMYLHSGSNTNTIFNNTIHSNGLEGISLSTCSSNIIYNNSIMNNSGGITLSETQNHVIHNNTFLNDGIFMSGNILAQWNTHTIENNSANGKSIYYYKDVNDKTVPTDAIQVLMANCDRFTIDNINASGTTVGIELGYCSWTNITNNTLSSNNLYGIYTRASTYNNITNNSIFQNNERGIYLYQGSHWNDILGNRVYQNANGGIILEVCSRTEIKNNVVYDDAIAGIHLVTDSHWNTIDNNFVHNSNWGIVLRRGTNNNKVTNNTVWDHTSVGIHLYKANINDIVNNTVYNSKYYGIELQDSDNNFVANNTIWNSSVHGIHVQDFSSSAIIDNNTIYGNALEGIHITWSTPITITGNTIYDNSRHGIYIYSTNNNDIVGNTVFSNNQTGIHLSSTVNSMIYHNNIIKNSPQAFDTSSNGNQWDNGYPSGGNFWSDYNGTDMNSTSTQDVPPPDGKGDTAYYIDPNSYDRWPLMNSIGASLLEPGWNLISIPHNYTNTYLGTVLSTIAGSYDSVSWYNVRDSSDPWKLNNTQKPPELNDLDSLNNTQGFWIHLTESESILFYYPGTPPTENGCITLYPGWNLVGYPSLNRSNRTYGLNNIDFQTDVDSIWTYNAATQKWKEVTESDYFEVGRGYWVHSKVTKTWIVPL